MNAQAPGRGAQLVTAGQRIGIGPQWLARVVTGGFHRILDRLDRGLAAGSLSFALPDGTKVQVAADEDEDEKGDSKPDSQQGEKP